ncbi:MAG: hypothetical protein ACR2ND_15125 [Solirubrobacteraceae bacterium]
MAVRHGVRPAVPRLSSAATDVRAAAAAGATIVVAALLIHGFHGGAASHQATTPQYPTSPLSRTAVRLDSHASATVSGTNYSVLGIQLLGSIPRSGVGLARNQEFAVVKIRLHNDSKTVTRASLGFVSLATGAADYLPRIDAAARLAGTHWQPLYLQRLAPGSTSHVKAFFVIPSNVSSAVALRVGSHRTGARASLIPLFLP